MISGGHVGAEIERSRPSDCAAAPAGEHLRARALRKQVIAAAREMHRRGLVTGTVGNVSARFRDGMLITATRRAFCEMRPGDVVAIGLDGDRLVAGRGEPSIERP